MEETSAKAPETGEKSGMQKLKEFAYGNRSEFGIALLCIYLFLLGLGTIGEIWDVEWILDLPLFRPPGKF